MPIFTKLAIMTTCLASMIPPAMLASTSSIPNPTVDNFRKDPEYARFFFTEARRKGLAEEGLLLLVSVAEQNLFVIGSSGLQATYPVSTSREGMGNRQNSLQTPGGWHRVARHIGQGAPVGQVFVGRSPTERVLSPAELRAEADEDRVVSRILWLQGLEPGVNRGGEVDSFRRYIYIHGTNQEHRLGRPASRGCIRMSNRDVIELFRMSENRKTWCLIHPCP